jgi:palmitoyl transferase
LHIKILRGVFGFGAALIWLMLFGALSCQALAEEITDAAFSEQPAGEDEAGLWGRFERRLEDIWASDRLDLYFPLYTWHNRLLYKPGYTEKYNEIPGGFGFGRSVFDEDGDEHALYIIGFSDSNDRFQPYGGYFFINNFYQKADFRAGIGFSLGFSARYEYQYVPFPFPLPVLSLMYKNISIQATYVPSGYNEGNVLFSWLRISL